jgi:hypothetical protein
MTDEENEKKGERGARAESEIGEINGRMTAKATPTRDQGGSIRVRQKRSKQQTATSKCGDGGGPFRDTEDVELVLRAPRDVADRGPRDVADRGAHIETWQTKDAFAQRSPAWRRGHNR